MSQTAYTIAYKVGVEGMVADSMDPALLVASFSQGVTPVGKLCVPGTNSMTGPATALPVLANGVSPGQAAPIGAGLVADPMIDSVWLGIPIYDASLPPYDTSLGYSSYADKQPMTVLRKGHIYVAPEAGAIINMQDVWVRTAANGGLTVLGKFAPAAGTGLVKFTRGRWVSGLMQSALAVLEIW